MTVKFKLLEYYRESHKNKYVRLIRPKQFIDKPYTPENRVSNKPGKEGRAELYHGATGIISVVDGMKMIAYFRDGNFEEKGGKKKSSGIKNNLPPKSDYGYRWPIAIKINIGPPDHSHVWEIEDD